MGDVLEERRRFSTKRLDELRQALQHAPELARGKACVYVIGSYGRGEAHAYSDLDLFIASHERQTNAPAENAAGLSQLDAICIKADLITTSRCLGYPDFSRDGEHLKLHTAGDLVEHLGNPTDDSTNSLTARLLLLLESGPLLGEDVYSSTIETVIESYWRDFEGRERDFVPAFLANDILRLWRTFCVNYEAGTKSDPPEAKAKRKLKNYKLKHSRLLTCYSGLAFLLAIHATQGTVTPADARQMVEMPPTARIEHIASLVPVSTHTARLLELYETFLAETGKPEYALVAEFRDEHRGTLRGGSAFGDAMFELLKDLGEKTRLYRLLVV